MNSILSVVTAAASQDLVALETVKAELALSGNANDALLSRRITAASGAVAGFCNRVFIAETVRETYRPPFVREEPSAWDLILLRRAPIVSIASVVEDDVTLTADTDYEHEAETGFLYRLCSGYRTSWRYRLCQSLVIEYSAGWALDDDAIAAVREAALLLVQGSWLERGRDPLVRSEEVPGVLRTDFWVADPTKGSALPPTVQDMLAPFVQPAV